MLVEYGSKRWVVRIDGSEPRKLGLSRDAEWRALNQAFAAGLAPQPVYRNPDLGTLVSAYLPGAESIAGTPDQQRLQEIGRLLRAIHQLAPVRFRLDPLSRARNYLAQSDREELPEGFEDACEELAASPVELCLCHNDLLAANRLISGGTLYAIDWEYVAMGDPLFDLAVVIEGDELTTAQADTLLTSWNREPLDGTQRHRLALQQKVYRGLCELWEQAAVLMQLG